MRTDREEFRRNDVVTTTAFIVLLGHLLMYFTGLPWVTHQYDDSGTVPQLIWGPALEAIWIENGILGALLLLSSRTRRVGWGILLGTLAAFALFVAFLLYVVLPEIG